MFSYVVSAHADIIAVAICINNHLNTMHMDM